ncbi:MAG TPA: 2-amino-4-hydroxy-6-hydroxymethyldihydropteridine diphosphokinase [Candidatus Polarisedimenticolaceae bacterium]|nr:2-amino-4-hydroxy-6-hydroxymethyldihydropteridine diphosphokinase [Candidatus Polarisedimenticolaceae bacterium]
MTGYVALGSNVGDRDAHLRAGILAMHAAGLRVTAASSVWETEPVGGAGPAWFLNMVVRVETELPPEGALDALLAIEAARGRRRSVRNAPRELDLDLLLLGDERRASPELTLPHPRMGERAFVLEPLAEIAPDLVVGARTVAGALAGLHDPHAVRRRGPLALPETLSVYSRAL